MKNSIEKQIEDTAFLNIPESEKPRVVIIGGGFGGVQLARELSEDLFQIVLIDRYNYHTFLPLLYQVATAGLEPDSIAGPLRKMIRKKRDFYFRMVRARKIDPEEQIVYTSTGELRFDYLAIATGARVNYYGQESIRKHAFPFNQITHALDLRSHIFQQLEKAELTEDVKLRKKLMTFTVVGAGSTGVELCGALAELKKHILKKDYPELNIDDVRICLIEGMDRILPAMSEKSGQKAHQYLDKMGVEIHTGNLTEKYDGDTVTLKNGQRIETATLVWAAGVKGNLVEGFGDESIQKHKLFVNTKNQVMRNRETGEVFDNVFAIGDVALMKTPRFPDGLPGLAQAAIQHGRHLAANLQRKVLKKKMKGFRYRSKGVLVTIGRNKAVADLAGNVRLYGFISWFVWMITILFYLTGFRSKAVVFANWVWNYFTFDRGIRLILRPSSKSKDTITREMEHEMKEI